MSLNKNIKGNSIISNVTEKRTLLEKKYCVRIYKTDLNGGK